MPTFRVNFHFKRTVGLLIEADDEAYIDKFLSKNQTFNPLEADEIEIISDETAYDEEDERGDYEILPEEDLTADFMITRDLKLVEVDS